MSALSILYFNVCCFSPLSYKYVQHLRVVIALTQWKSEIEKFCERNALSICTYHGPDRVKNTPRALLTKYDIVLTTYQVLEADFRKMVSPNKVKVSFFSIMAFYLKTGSTHWIAFN